VARRDVGISGTTIVAPLRTSRKPGTRGRRAIIAILLLFSGGEKSCPITNSDGNAKAFTSFPSGGREVEMEAASI
jgi:hypothetical protein